MTAVAKYIVTGKWPCAVLYPALQHRVLAVATRVRHYLHRVDALLNGAGRY